MVESKSCFTYVTDFGWTGDLDQVATPPLLTLMLHCLVFFILILMEESLFHRGPHVEQAHLQLHGSRPFVTKAEVPGTDADCHGPALLLRTLDR